MGKVISDNYYLNELRRLETEFSNNFTISIELELFLIKYFIIEAVIRKILGKTNSEQYSVRDVSKILPDLDDDVIRKLYDSQLDKRGNKSARNFRNKVVHNFKKEDIKEIENRFYEFDEAFEDMFTYILN